MITQLRSADPTIDPITTPESITTRARRATSKGQRDYRGTPEAIYRTGHRQGNKRQYTPRHHDPMGGRARLRGRAAVIDSVTPATSTTPGLASC